MSQSDKDHGADIFDPLGFLHKNSNKQPDQPQMPDYIGAANAQSLGSIQANVANNMMAHPDVYTPLGSQTWTQDGTQKVWVPGHGDVNIPHFTQKTTLSPEQQALYEGQTGMQRTLQGQAENNLSTPINDKSANDVVDRAYSAVTSRMNPMWEQREQQEVGRLANQGVAPGSEAYDRAMRDFNQGRNDAYQQANLGALQIAPQALQMQQALRDMPLNELQAIKGGSPVSMPQFQPSQFAMGAQGPQTLQATGMEGNWSQAMYNSQIQQQNQRMSGLGALGVGLMGLF